ncbi:MAG: hypothetical protein U5R46_02270 [Gammaproteobacteria bacterium]|nr:hypothetical protein [Gammaproteobacteria bacterium]
MNQDFRIKIGFFNNPKTHRLRRRLGAEGVLSLIRLWEYAAQHRSKGVLYDMDDDDIAAVSDWSGDSSFVECLRKFGFLEETADGWLALHDWEEHNGYAFYAEERSERAREAAEKRWAEK